MAIVRTLEVLWPALALVAEMILAGVVELALVAMAKGAAPEAIAADHQRAGRTASLRQHLKK